MIQQLIKTGKQRGLWAAAALLLPIAGWWQGCLKAPEYPIEPVITFRGFSKQVMLQNEQDSFRLVFGFTDGDGDLGQRDSQNVFLTDMRTGRVDTYRIPPLPANGADNGISGEVTLTLFSSCCIYSPTQACFPNPAVPTDTVTYLLQVRDRAGNRSNTLVLPPIVLLCQ